jgi:hypothetical protein
MTEAVASLPVYYNGNGSTTTFPFNNKFINNSEIQVWHTSASDVDTLLTLDTDYTLTGAGTATGSVEFPTGGSFPTLAIGEQLTIMRATPLDQLQNYVNTDLRLKNVEDGLDRVVRQIQEVEAGLDMTVKQSVTNTLDPITEEQVVAGITPAHSVEIQTQLILDATALTVADGLGEVFVVPLSLHGAKLTKFKTHIGTTSSSGLPSFALYNVTQGWEMLTTNSTILVGQVDSNAAGTTPEVIDTASDHNVVSVGDELRFDCDGNGNGTTGYRATLRFLLP